MIVIWSISMQCRHNRIWNRWSSNIHLWYGSVPRACIWLNYVFHKLFIMSVKVVTIVGKECRPWKSWCFWVIELKKISRWPECILEAVHVIKQYPFVIWFIPRAWNVSIKSWCFWVIELTRGMYECSGDGLVKNNNIPNKMYGNVINRRPSISVKKLLCNYHDKKELSSLRVQIKQKILCILQLLIWLCLFIVWAFVHMHHAIIQL